jgi:hypothetical protein
MRFAILAFVGFVVSVSACGTTGAACTDTDPSECCNSTGATACVDGYWEWQPCTVGYMCVQEDGPLCE